MILKSYTSHIGQNTIKKCTHCKKVRECIHTCLDCKSVFYCSIHCKQEDFISSHMSSCLIFPLVMQNNQKSTKNGRVGLENIGNTCYLNSCIQCLSHTTELTTYFLKKYYKDQINLGNILGLKGELANAYYTCVYNLWAQNKETYRPDMFRRIISQKNEQFTTFQQHDASQLFATVVDGIHEDLNRSKNRISKTMPDIYGKSDQDGAKISWLHFLLNNQSIIVDTMTGLFKSVITCPSCSHVSIKFDPFNMVNLPIPEVNQIKRLKFYVMYFQKPIVRCEIEFQEINFQKFKIQAARAIRRNHRDFKLFFLSQKRQIYDVENLKIQEFHKLFPLDKVYLLQLTPEQRQLTNKFQLTCSFCVRIEGKFYNLWLKRPFFIDIDSETGLSFTKTILRFLYIFCFKDRLKKTIFGVQGVQYEEYMKQMLSSTNRPIKLIIVKTRKRVNNDYILTDVCYEKQVKMIADKYLISEGIEYVLKNDEEQNNYGEKTPYNKKFQMIIEINQQSQKMFDFKKLICLEEAEEKKKQKNQINIYKCFDAFGCEENLTAEWYCEWCETKKKINKRMSIYRSPDILVIVLNRFKVVENGARTKNDKQVNFPLELDLEKYVLDHKPMNSWIKIAKKLIDYKNPSYNFEPNLHVSQKFDLYAVVNHEGSLNAGHYYAYAKNEGKWYKFNDSKVTETHEINQKHAYMLFYRRKKQ